jgi:hypothetical protein
MRTAFRTAPAFMAAIALASCMDLSSPAGAGRSSLAIAPRFSRSASLASATLSQAGVSYNTVRIVISRPGADAPQVLKDTSIAFSPSSPALTLDLSLDAAPSEELLATLEFLQDGAVIFSGAANVRTVAPASARTTTPVEIEVSYAGPGATTSTVSITPGSGSYSASSSTQFTAKALDASSTEIAGTPIFWSVSDGNLASISATGLLTPTGNHGIVDVTATAANGVSQTITVRLAAAAAGLRVIQGAGQSGAPGSLLPDSAIVELFDADNLPAASSGQTVNFSASPGASISPASATLDANGHASARMELGPTAGTTYIFTATVGTMSVSWAGTARPGTPTHFVTNGPTTLELTAGVVPDTIPTLRVADALDNSVSGVILKITIQEDGANVVEPFQVPADSVGLLQVHRIAPTRAGVYTLLVEAADPELASTIAPVLYNVTIDPGPAAKLAFTQEPPSTVVSGQTVAVTVTIQDQFGNTVPAPAQDINLSPAGASGWNITGSVTPVNGVASFSVPVTSSIGTVNGARILAAGANLPAVLSASFTITP